MCQTLSYPPGRPQRFLSRKDSSPASNNQAESTSGPSLTPGCTQDPAPLFMAGPLWQVPSAFVLVLSSGSSVWDLKAGWPTLKGVVTCVRACAPVSSHRAEEDILSKRPFLMGCSPCWPPVPGPNSRPLTSVPQF